MNSFLKKSGRLYADIPVDFVILWVDDKDPEWQKRKMEYTGVKASEGNTCVRYRDWETLKYWFRGVEKYAPWVRNIYFVTDDQKPEWLNMNHPKLKWVKHTDFIPREYLPTFSAHPIEWNLHRIEGLSEHFVYFNDDVFLIKETKITDFFRNGLPCDIPILGPLYPAGFFSYILFNNISLLNRHFSLKKSIKKHPIKWLRCQNAAGLIKLLLYGRKDLIPNSVSRHIHFSFRKSTFQMLWDGERSAIENTCKHRQRNKEDISLYCIRDWQLFTGAFYPHKTKGKMFHTATLSYNNRGIHYLLKQKGKVICLNDSEDEVCFEDQKKIILDAFEKLFPERSTFEV